MKVIDNLHIHLDDVGLLARGKIRINDQIVDLGEGPIRRVEVVCVYDNEDLLPHRNVMEDPRILSSHDPNTCRCCANGDCLWEEVYGEKNI